MMRRIGATALPPVLMVVAVLVTGTVGSGVVFARVMDVGSAVQREGGAGDPVGLPASGGWSAKPVGVCLDGPRAGEIRALANFFAGVRWENAVVHPGITRDALGDKLSARYPVSPRGPADIVEWWTDEDSGRPRFREALIGYASRTFRPGEVAFCSLDYENGLYLFSPDPSAVGDVDPQVFEDCMARFLVESPRVCNRVRPDVKWTIWQYPKPNWTDGQILSRKEVFDEMEWLAISVCSFGPDDPRWQGRLRERGAQARFVQSVHPLGTILEVVACGWNRNRGEGASLADARDLVRIMHGADGWVSWHCFWIGAGNADWTVQENQDSLLPGGNVREAVQLYRSGPLVDITP